MMFNKPIDDKNKEPQERLDDIYNYLGDYIEQQNRHNSTTDGNTVYSGSTANGTAATNDKIRGGVIFIAVVGGIPVTAVRYGNIICGRGGNNVSSASLTLTITGANMTIAASAVLEKLILIF